MKILKDGKQKITFYFGKQELKGKQYNHTGIDLVKEPNNLDYVLAAEKGKVIEVVKNVKGFKEKSYGNYVLLEHNNKTETLYAHLKEGSIKVNKGNIIQKGEVIGYMGSTGFAFGAHLHFEVRENGKKVNPLPYLNNNKKIIGYGESKYIVENYRTNYVMRIRQGASIKYIQKKVKDLTEDGRKNATSKRLSDLACYKKGTVFTALEIIEEKSSESIWARSPSGYICIEDKMKKYCTKI